MRVDALPPSFKPLVALYGYGAAAALASYYLVQRPTIRVAVHGGDHVAAGANAIFCHWHEAVSLFFQANVPRMRRAFREAPQAWMQHPLWHMKPIHLFLRGIGVREIVLGSTGHAGRSAADGLVALLRAGYSTVILPDGPAGPPRQLKKGVLHIACQSGVPIVPLRLSASRCFRAATWDRKIQAVPFSTIRITVGAPIRVTEDGFDEAAEALIAALG
jgi:lysophospholipid acyltransferase (LPLAT)-like uncharacterized protein